MRNVSYGSSTNCCIICTQDHFFSNNMQSFMFVQKPIKHFLTKVWLQSPSVKVMKNVFTWPTSSFKNDFKWNTSTSCGTRARCSRWVSRVYVRVYSCIRKYSFDPARKCLSPNWQVRFRVTNKQPIAFPKRLGPTQIMFQMSYRTQSNVVWETSYFCWLWVWAWSCSFLFLRRRRKYTFVSFHLHIIRTEGVEGVTPFTCN